MRFTIVIATVGLLAQGTLTLKVNGIEFPETPTGLVLTDIIQVDNEIGAKSFISVYHDIEADTSKRDLEVEGSLRLNKRCGSNRSECHRDNGAWDKACYDLLDWLRAKSSDRVLAQSPRSICSTSSESEWFGKIHQCCASWSQNAASARRTNLVSAAEKAMRDCVYSNDNKKWVSAKSLDVKLGATCLTQCLSNRPDGCK